MGSRTEKLLTAMLNGETVTDFEPTSRVEAYLLYLIKGDGELPAPVSRLDALLYRLAEQGIGTGGGKVGALAAGTIETVTEGDLQGVTIIRDYAFRMCKQLKTVVIPEGVATIGANVFYGCSALESVRLPESLTEFGTMGYIFANCEALTSIDIPGSVASIPTYTFRGCTGLTDVRLHEGLTLIKDHGFYNCRALTAMTIPATVVEIEAQALHIGAPTALATITFLSTTPPTIAAETFDATRLAKIIVPTGCGEAYKTAENWTAFADYIEEATA